MARVDASEVLLYASQLDHVVDRLEPEFEQITERAALNVKNEARRLLRQYFRRRYLKHYYRSITYDMDGPLAAEIGPDASMPQGGMGTGVEFGSRNTAPAPHMFPALDKEDPKYRDRILRAYVRGLK
jgi:hypothetical protein